MLSHARIAAAAMILTLATLATDASAAEHAFDFETASEFASGRPPEKTVGVVTSLKVNGVELASDIEVFDPANSGGKKNVVGVLEGFRWPGGVGDPLDLAVRLSAKERQRVVASKRKNPGPGTVVVQYAIYTCAGRSCFLAAEPARGPLSLNAKQFDVDGDTLTLQLAPPTTSTTLMFATSKDAKVIKKWGVTIAGQ